MLWLCLAWDDAGRELLFACGGDRYDHGTQLFALDARFSR